MYDLQKRPHDLKKKLEKPGHPPSAVVTKFKYAYVYVFKSLRIFYLEKKKESSSHHETARAPAHHHTFSFNYIIMDLHHLHHTHSHVVSPSDNRPSDRRRSPEKNKFYDL